MYQLKILAYLPTVTILYLLLAAFTCIEFNAMWLALAIVFDIFDYMKLDRVIVLAYAPWAVVLYILLVIVDCIDFSALWLILAIIFDSFDYIN